MLLYACTFTSVWYAVPGPARLHRMLSTAAPLHTACAFTKAQCATLLAIEGIEK